MITNEEFLEYLEQEHENRDWDNLPDLDLTPDVYVVSGEQIRTNRHGREITSGFTIAKEYATMEEAESQVAYMREAMKKDEAWSGLVEDSITIKAKKPLDIVNLHVVKILKDSFEAGETKFPIYLP